MGKLVKLGPILLVNETISKDSESLMSPQVDQIVLVGECLQVDHEHTLDDLGQVTKVESVVALGRSGEEVRDGLDIDIN